MIELANLQFTLPGGHPIPRNPSPLFRISFIVIKYT